MNKTSSPISSEVVGKIDPISLAVSAVESATLELTSQQRTAIEKLTSGHSLIDSAMAAGVNRTTLYRWLKRDAHFQAAYNAWQEDALATARGRLMALAGTAVSTVEQAMHKGDAKTAVTVLKGIGLLDRPTVGSTDPDEIRQLQEIEQKRTEKRLSMEATLASIGA